MPTLQELRDLARGLRARGLSYSDIARRLGTPLPRATLEAWCADVARPLSRKAQLTNDAARQRAELDQLSLSVSADSSDVHQRWHLSTEGQNLFLVLLALYATGGERESKSSYLEFVSRHHDVAQLFLWLLRVCYEIDERKFRVQLHYHEKLDEFEVVSAWHAALDIPPAQFLRPLADLNIVGSICAITYLSAPLRTCLDAECEHLLSRFGKLIDSDIRVGENK